MSLQGFSNSRLQGFSGILQAFGIAALRGSSPYGIYVYDGDVYVLDIELQMLKAYDIYGVKTNEVSLEPKEDPLFPGFPVLLSFGSLLHVNASRILVSQGRYRIGFDFSLNQISEDFGVSESAIFYDDDFYLFTNNKTVNKYDISGNLISSFNIGRSLFNSAFDVKNDNVYIVGETRSTTVGDARVLMLVFDLSGNQLDEFEYWYENGTGDLPDRIGYLQNLFTVNGNYCHSTMYSSSFRTVYRTSVITGAELDSFNLSYGLRNVAWANNELYYSTSSPSIIVCNDQTGEVLREWSTND